MVGLRPTAPIGAAVKLKQKNKAGDSGFFDGLGLFVVELVALVAGVAGEVQAEAAEGVVVHGGKDHR